MAIKRNNPKAGWYFRTRMPKRLFPKKYSADYVPTPRIDHNAATVYNSQRSKSTIGGRGSTEHNFDSNFLKEVPQTRSLSTFDYREKKMVRSERGKVVDDIHDKIWKYEGKNLLELYIMWQGDRYQGVKKFNQVVLESVGEHFKFIHYFTGNEHLFVQESKNVRFISRVYHGRDVAMFHKNNNTITWLVVDKIS